MRTWVGVAVVLSVISLVLVVYLLVAGSTAPPGSKPPEEVKAKVVSAAILLAEQGGECRVVTKTNPVTAGKGHVIIWTIMNQCSSDQEVSLRDFQNGDPLEPGEHKVPVRAHETQPPLVTKIRDEAKIGRYPYAVYLNGKKQQDPEIVIEYSN